MASSVADNELGEALLQSVEHGAFPQSEHVASAPVPTTALPKLLEVIRKARNETKNEIRKASREAAPDVDGWIEQARKLQSDIKRSQETAQEIVQEARAKEEHTSRLADANAKLSLLYSEIAYNDSLAQVIQRLKEISSLLDAAQDASVHGDVLDALNKLEEVDVVINTRLNTAPSIGDAPPSPNPALGNARVVGVLQNRAADLKRTITDNVTGSWNALLMIDSAGGRISCKETMQRDTSITINVVVEALTKLGLLDGLINSFARHFDKVIVCPRLTGSNQVKSSIIVDGNDIRIDGQVANTSVKAALEDIHSIAEYLSTHLPPSIAKALSAKLVPVISNRLIKNWLLPAVPLATDGVHDFQELLSYVLGLAEYLDELEWSGQDRLRNWVDQSAQIWLARQKEAAIVRVHQFCPKLVREKKTVERVETQMVSRGDAMLGQPEDQEEEWGAEWGEEDQPEEEKPPEKDTAQTPAPEVEEEDMSAWDDEEDTRVEDAPDLQAGEKIKEEEDGQEEEDPEAWGWGDETETEPAPSTSKPAEQHTENGKTGAAKHLPAEQEVTLRETYTVTAVPDAIIELILQVVADVATLNQPDLARSAISPASVGLYTIPSLVLAMYRATASSHYSKDIAGNMLIYNDCTRLSDRLRSLVKEQAELEKTSSLPSNLRPSVRLNFDDDIRAIERFGKRAYGREMESQRTIIKDLLSGAQGFKTCTTPPFDAECDNAIAMAIDRIEEVKRHWQSVLSHSALLQSLGSLVATALTKFIDDVEEMTDIAEEESKKLRSYCVSLSSLSSLFQTSDDAGEVKDMTSIYTPNWFKFQYLSEILDSSLADIRYFWTDGELKLEMDVEEVVDLIKALFAESEHRRKAISEVRRTSMAR